MSLTFDRRLVDFDALPQPPALRTHALAAAGRIAPAGLRGLTRDATIPATDPSWLDRPRAAALIARLNPSLSPPSPASHYVVAGQQPGLLTGPLYTFLKAVSAIALARDLGARTGTPVRPLFWIASEDHDVLEVNRVTVNGRRFMHPYAGPLDARPRAAGRRDRAAGRARAAAGVPARGAAADRVHAWVLEIDRGGSTSPATPRRFADCCARSSARGSWGWSSRSRCARAPRRSWPRWSSAGGDIDERRWRRGAQPAARRGASRRRDGPALLRDRRRRRRVPVEIDGGRVSSADGARVAAPRRRDADPRPARATSRPAPRCVRSARTRCSRCVGDAGRADRAGVPLADPAALRGDGDLALAAPSAHLGDLPGTGASRARSRRRGWRRRRRSRARLRMLGAGRRDDERRAPRSANRSSVAAQALLEAIDRLQRRRRAALAAHRPRRDRGRECGASRTGWSEERRAGVGRDRARREKIRDAILPGGGAPGADVNVVEFLNRHGPALRRAGDRDARSAGTPASGRDAGRVSRPGRQRVAKG